MLQVKCLRVLQYFPPPEDPAVAKTLNEVLARIITGSDAAKNVNKNNAQHAIVFEAIALALALEADPDLLTAGERGCGLSMHMSCSWHASAVQCFCAAHSIETPQCSSSPLSCGEVEDEGPASHCPRQAPAEHQKNFCAQV